MLNELLAMDPDCISVLTQTRVPCNAKIKDHPTVQVMIDPQGQSVVGLVGVLNGLFGVDSRGWGGISFETKDGQVQAFRVLEDVVLTKGGTPNEL